MSGFWTDLLGTTKNYFRIGRTGPRLKDVSGNLVVRNASDTADADLTAAAVHVSGDSIELNSDAAGTGTDRKLVLQRNAASGGDLTIIFPAGKATDGYFMRQKAGTPAGVLEFEFVAPSASSSQITSDTTSLAFGSGATVPLLTLSSTAVIDKIQIINDVPFNGTPSASIGIAGSTSKYVAASDIDLAAPAGTVTEIHPGLPAPGAPENLIISFVSGDATAGAARVLVYYADAPV